MQYTQFVIKIWRLFAPNSLNCLISTILICHSYFRYSWFKDGDFDNIISSSSNLTVYLNLQAQVQTSFKQFSNSPNVNREIYEILFCIDRKKGSFFFSFIYATFSTFGIASKKRFRNDCTHIYKTSFYIILVPDNYNHISFFYKSFDYLPLKDRKLDLNFRKSVL